MRLRKIEAPQAPPFPPTEERKEKREERISFRAALLLFLALVVAAGLLYWHWRSRWIITTGRVVAAEVQITSPITGRIALLHIQEGDQVVQGQLLAKLADEEMTAELKRAEARLSGARSHRQTVEQAGLGPTIPAHVEAAQHNLDLAREGYRRAVAEVEQADILHERARVVAERAERLFLLRAITRNQWEEAVAEWRKAQAGYAVARAELSEAKAAIQGAEKTLEKAKEALQYSHQGLVDKLPLLEVEAQQAAAEVEQVKSRLAQTMIYAPREGLVSWISRQAGEVVDHNDTILTLIDPKEVWVEAYVSGSDLSGLRAGLEAWVKIEGLSNQKFRGRVSLFYPTEGPPERILRTGPQLAPSPSRLSTFIHPVKIVFADRIPARLRPEMIARILIPRR